MSADPPPPIYVGYLPLPPRHKRLLAIALPTLALFVVAVAAAIATLQHSPPAAAWSSDISTHTGILLATPYPMLLTDDPTDPPILLVRQNKHGALGLHSLHAQRVEIRGTLITRDNARILELSPDTQPRPVPGPTLQPGPEVLTHVTLRGEIVDSKCCLGAMKPGEGKAHRACATLCIRGGIPPILVSAEGAVTLYTFLTDANGNPANTMVLDSIAEPVEVTGTLSLRDHTRTLAIERIDRLAD